MMYGFYDISPILPWHGQPNEDRRFRRILIIFLLLSLLIVITVSLTPRPVIDRQEVETIPPRLAKMILERKKIPPPPPPKVEKPKEKDKPKEKKKVEKKKVKKKVPTKVQKQARKVAKKEIAQFSSILSELSDMKPLPMNKKPLTSSGKKAAKVQREMITSRATQSSGGVSSGRASHASSSKQSLSSVGTTHIASSISSVTAAATAAATDNSDQRSREQINRVFDQNKGALYALYNRALRKNPSLAGEVSVKIEISPEGMVISCKVTSSDIDDAELLRKLTARIKLFNFGSADVKVWKDNVVWDFIPT